MLYPVVKPANRPTLEKNKYDANIYYQVENKKASTIRPKLDQEGNIVPNYWKYEAGETNGLIPEYNSLRIEGEEGIKKDGKTYYYADASTILYGLQKIDGKYYFFGTDGAMVKGEVTVQTYESNGMLDSAATITFGNDG